MGELNASSNRSDGNVEQTRLWRRDANCFSALAGFFGLAGFADFLIAWWLQRAKEGAIFLAFAGAFGWFMLAMVWVGCAVWAWCRAKGGR